MKIHEPPAPVLPGVEIAGTTVPGLQEVLTTEALAFVVDLHRRFNPERLRLLAERTERQKRFDEGVPLMFPEDTEGIRERDWKVAVLPHDIRDRRVEITGPVDRKMVINALNSGAYVFMADFEDANSPTWSNNIAGQINLRDAVRRTITYSDPASGKNYVLKDRTAVLFVRPRGWHMEEKGLLVDGQRVSASLFDFGLYFFHNVKALLERGTGPYFYLPKLEGRQEARLWNDVFVCAQRLLGIPNGTIKATVLIETITAAFEMDEILYELRDHSAGLNCGRWDYIFSLIKRLGKDPRFVLPDRDQVTMAVPFMDAYSRLVIRTCHRRNVHAMGGMSAFIPIKDDPAANDAAMQKVRTDKEREARNGHDGTWVAHPGLVPIALDVFDRLMPGPNQLHMKRQDDAITERDLLQPFHGAITEAGVRKNIDVAIRYVESWLRGFGAVAIHDLMEDAATAEIGRTQLWQWVYHGSKLDDGRTISADLVQTWITEGATAIEREVGSDGFHAGRYGNAVLALRELVATKEPTEFLTTPAYALL
ncbi:MAG TPA: malate synthase A [Flavobacteriales bacterium]